ncbi:MAG: hypothetical protein OMM_03771 [Candidatus Magnetoglobus multicellularis str. Araruama]|uniref:Uncharacterized protein n=1 Tax=Candidatus Magnetoglobus multicellularis str. Araruama TaxID=890399 RepID=A0A1V1P4C8_9BACT|nr:MAG: hypothetical protein OMM_03771 [Candidatus Magnetoglobus multicellularis str. Araruama]
MNEKNNYEGVLNVKIVDSIMGSGKTTWAINKIVANPEKKYIYITPYLDEIKRMKNATKDTCRMYEPNLFNGTTKKADFHKLLSEGKNICSTHALFTKADHTTRQALRSNQYTLILDEVMDVVSELKDFNIKDLNMLTNEGFATVQDNFLIWNTEKDEDCPIRYIDIMNMAKNRNIVVIGTKLIYWNFPVDIFSYFDEVYILTYLFDAQIQKYYYDFYGIEYKYYQVVDYNLKPYSKTLAKERVSKIKPLINIYEGKFNLIGEDEHSLSKTWFDNDIKNNGTLCKILQKNLYNYFNNEHRNNGNKDRLWCTFKDAQQKLKGKGYTKRFLSMNMRATNDYRETKVLAYCCNRYLRPTLKTFFSKKEISIDEELWSISELIQWIWRSQIREGEPINIYIPSKRMRDNLLLF